MRNEAKRVRCGVGVNRSERGGPVEVTVVCVIYQHVGGAVDEKMCESIVRDGDSSIWWMERLVRRSREMVDRNIGVLRH